MPMSNLRTPGKPIDGRITLYRLARLLLLVLVFGLLARVFIFEIRPISTNQMHPSLHVGDRLLFNKLGILNPLSGDKSLRPGNIVLFSLSRNGTTGNGVFRIAAAPRDTIAVIEGKVKINGDESQSFGTDALNSNPLPAQYSPRDAFSTFVLPSRGDSVSFEQTPFRDLVFYVSMIKQESPDESYDLITRLKIGGVDSSNYIIENFSLYDGSFSSIPDSLRYNWFFWDRLIEYFHTLEKDEQRFEVEFQINKANEFVSGYRFETDYYFLLADNWDIGYDSRFFGPISKKNIRGTAACILWSSEMGKGLKGFRPQRAFKIIQKPVSEKQINDSSSD